MDAKKEWDYPRIIIDNNPKLPSRVRAFLYNGHKKYIKDKDMSILYPPESGFKNIREIIEDVKRNKNLEKTKIALVSEINSFNRNFNHFE